MLRSTEIALEFPTDVHVNPSMGSLFQGALMDIIEPEVATKLHNTSLRPYSQVVYWDNKKKSAIWRLGTLTDDTYEHLIFPLQKTQKLHLTHMSYDVTLKKIETVKTISFADLAGNFIKASAAPSRATWQTLSVMSFKQQGRYVILPEIRLFYQNLLARWNTFSPILKLEDAELAEKLAEHCRLMRYDLRSQIFSVEGQLIYGCYGCQQYQFLGYDMLRRIQGILTAFAEYAGVGIKTAMGMGAVKTIIQ